MHPVLDLDFLAAFVESEAAGSFSKAARRLGRSQSVVSERIAAAEAELGYPLFSRGRSLKLTARGRELLPKAQRVLEHYGHFEREAKALWRTEAGTLHIGFDLDMPASQFVPLIESFAAAFPRVDLQIEKLTAFDVPWFFRHTPMSMALVFKHTLTAPFAETQVASFPMVLVAAKSHPMLSELNNGIVEPDVLRQHRQLVVSVRDPDSPPPFILSARSWIVDTADLALALAARGLGWAVLSERQLAAHPEHFRTVTVLKTPLALPEERLVLEASEDKTHPAFLDWWRQALLGGRGSATQAPGRSSSSNHQ